MKGTGQRFVPHRKKSGNRRRGGPKIRKSLRQKKESPIKAWAQLGKAGKEGNIGKVDFPSGNNDSGAERGKRHTSQDWHVRKVRESTLEIFGMTFQR